MFLTYSHGGKPVVGDILRKLILRKGFSRARYSATDLNHQILSWKKNGEKKNSTNPSLTG